MRHSEENLQKILETLLKNDSDGFVTLDDLSQVLNISKRSVQNYLNKADSWLLEHDLPDVRIIKKQGYGIRLSVDFSERQKLASLIKSRYFTMLEGSVERRIEILRSLVFSKEELTIQFLADQFYEVFNTFDFSRGCRRLREIVDEIRILHNNRLLIV